MYLVVQMSISDEHCYKKETKDGQVNKMRKKHLTQTILFQINLNSNNKQISLSNQERKRLKIIPT